MPSWFTELSPVVQALVATGGTWLLTACGAGIVFLFGQPRQWIQDAALGFAAGVMVAASCWSLLIPAIDRGGILPAVIGLLVGGAALFGLERLTGRIQRRAQARATAHSAGSGLAANQGILLLVIAITLHNIPEGAAIGVAFGADRLGSAVALALGIGIQNFPEGMAVSLPLRRQGLSRGKAFAYGQASALVEPAAGAAGAYLVTAIQAILPYGLAFAAGAMLYVVVEEMIPEAVEDRQIQIAAGGFLAGFAVMMTLDTTLG